MDIKEALQLIIAAGNTIDTLWNTFIGVHFALIGAIYFLNRDFAWTEKIVLIIAYGVFLRLNSGALIASYELYQALVADIKALDGDAYAKFKTTHALIRGFDYTDRTLWVIGVHTLAAAIVFAVVMFKEKVIRTVQVVPAKVAV